MLLLFLEGRDATWCLKDTAGRPLPFVLWAGCPHRSDVGFRGRAGPRPSSPSACPREVLPLLILLLWMVRPMKIRYGSRRGMNTYKEMATGVWPTRASPEARVKLQAKRWLTSMKRISTLLLHRTAYNLKYPCT